jgi:ribosome small subunit-dependent GTPase A
LASPRSVAQRTCYLREAGTPAFSAFRCYNPDDLPYKEDQLDPDSVSHRERKLLPKYKPPAATDPIEGREVAEAQVVSVTSGKCQVVNASGTFSCRNQLPVAPGDFVALVEGHRIKRVLPRRTWLSRPDPGNPRREKVVAANMDVVVVVVAAADPPLHPGIIDRYLIAIEQGGAAAAICVNKSELAASDAIEHALHPYRKLSAPIVMCSARTGAGIDELRAIVAGKLCVFVGHSGVGKSSLLNALLPAAGAATGDVSRVTGKGQHTTSRSQIYNLSDGARVIDTPGVREFGLWKLEPAEVRLYFHDFDEAAAHCRFSDCTHLHEPDCMVRSHVEAGLISAARYERYRRICTATD